MTRRVQTILAVVPRSGIIGMGAVALTACLFATLGWYSARLPMAAGLWFQDEAFVLASDVEATLGGPLTADEIERLKQVSQRELQRAFTGLRIDVGQRRDAFWSVGVVPAVSRRGRFPAAAQTYAFGLLGGRGLISFSNLALNAVRHAPEGASREQIIDGIGRGIGNAAAHEFAHQILGAAALHNRRDRDSYEYFSSDRPAQYYGELRWAALWPLLEQKLRN